MDRTLFNNLCREYFSEERSRAGIGTLGEKTIHAVLKDYMDSNPAHQEQRLGSYVADIYDGSAVVEIQTRSFNRLRGKLELFLKEVPVTVVYPIPSTKYLSWVDPETGEVTERRRSPKRGGPYDVMRELYKVKMFLKDPNIHFHLIYLDVEEYRLKNGYARDGKKGSERIERIPTDMAGELTIDTPEDYRQFVPSTLPKEFDSKDFQKAAHITRGTAQVTLNILSHMGAVKKTGKRGRACLYERSF